MDRRKIKVIYDALNRVTDGNGNTWRYAYDRKDRLIRATSPEGKSRSYAYNGSGKVTRITDFDGADSTIEYNSLNRPECLTDKEGRKTYRSYDLMWNISQETAPSGAVARYHYDEDNRLTEAEICTGEGREPERIVRYSYDPNGNLLEVADTTPGEEEAPSPTMRQGKNQWDGFPRECDPLWGEN